MKQSIEILLKHLKEKGITKHILCPSASIIINKLSTTIPEATELIDERSAGYVATGMCAELEEPVVVWCANNDSYRNLSSALTEAYYRKLPVLVVALAPYDGSTIDQSINPNDTIRYYINNTLTNRLGTEESITVAINYLNADVKGPVYLPLNSYEEVVIDKEPNSNTYKEGKTDITSIVNTLPFDTCIHIGKDMVCDCSHNVISREDHCTMDGNLSMLIGSAVIAENQLHVGIFSTDEIAYDLNMLGNRHVGGNIVIITLIHEKQAFAIYDVAKRFGWDCKQFDSSNMDTIKDFLEIGDKPQYIEVAI